MNFTKFKILFCLLFLAGAFLPGVVLSEVLIDEPVYVNLQNDSLIHFSGDTICLSPTECLSQVCRCKFDFEGEKKEFFLSSAQNLEQSVLRGYVYKDFKKIGVDSGEGGYSTSDSFSAVSLFESFLIVSDSGCEMKTKTTGDLPLMSMISLSDFNQDKNVSWISGLVLPYTGNCAVEEVPHACCCTETERTNYTVVRNCRVNEFFLVNGQPNCQGEKVFDFKNESGSCAYWENEPIKDIGPEAGYGIGLSVEKLQQEASKLNFLNLRSPSEFIGRIIGFLMGAMGTLALVMYIWAGFSWMTAAGSAEKISLAKTIFIWTTIGVILALSSYIIVNFIFTSLS